MKELINRFIRNLIIFTAVLAVSGFAFSYFTAGIITKFWPFLLLLFAGITLTLVTLLFSASEKKFSRFSNTFMIASMLKILLLLILIGAYSFRFQADAIRFSVTLLIFYLLYLAFEIYWLMKLQQSDKNE
jgi:H+/Cl- antiporter ClcA